ncbi:dihydrofolate reductase [uncultured Fenollaria sp.]|uniref:dihydrofolate reductase n=1 Tax=uncultured Fenollaria sp. TaxID=1686315 RepID=UPI0025F32BA3|nr:dihydrofolate reductase [uncultured Fenollaria sp.]
MILVMAVDAKWAIGYKGDMLTRIPEDLKHFKEMTMGGVLVMGRKTFDATGALPGRETIIVSRSLKEIEGAHIAHNLDDLREMIKEKFSDKKIFLVGGASLIDQLIDEVDEAEITFIKKDFEPYDTVMRNLDKDEAFELVQTSEEHAYQDMKFEYRRYKRK